MLGAGVRFPARQQVPFDAKPSLQPHLLYGENLRIFMDLFHENNISATRLIGKLNMVEDLVAILYYFFLWV